MAQQGIVGRCQQALFDLERAFTNWWTNPGHFRRPTWNKAGINGGFAICDLSVRYIPRPCDPGPSWHVSFTSPQPVFKRESTGAIVGLDMGVVTTITTSSGDFLSMPVNPSASGGCNAS